MRAGILVFQCLERTRLVPIFASQVRTKWTGNTRRLKDPHESKKESKLYTSKQRIKKVREPIVRVRYIADKPLDDVWISEHYPEPSHSFSEIIKRHQEYAQPVMYDTLDSRVYADMDINMRTKKQTKFVNKVKNTVELPHPFDTGVKQNVVLICKETADVKLALQLGASRAGPELVKMIKDGVMKKQDFDHVCATPDMMAEVLNLRGPLREECPETRNGKISADIEKLLNFYLHGLTYEAVKLQDALGRLQVPFGTLEMPTESLYENFNFIIDAVNSHQPKGAPGAFISNLTIIAPPSPERFNLQLDEYSPDRHKKVTDNVEEELDEDSDDEEEEVGKKKAKRR